ncbi:peptidoglycan-binding protein LysM [Streptomyces scopuliridis]|uniref:Peptidoglycan-binding protein LysM n=1 Tax=Streptomyces scopuliridis TaxID=452529 RepID=A0ACD4ZRT8_9ACTN|nr:peptidoglycan-binding protein LysM [Streptomyces scopuliridis]WSC01223.1 peptidoglycan-binding protein LysM [Streptomyces scopuliridis]
MGEIWIKEAERMGGGSIGGAMDTPSAPGRVVWHTTESGVGNASFNAVGKYLTNVSSEPHILYDPSTDRLGQYGPLNQSARALKNDGSTRTNRTGKVCIQIEVLGRAASPFTKTWRPGTNFKALMRAIRSWGVPDVWPAGALAASYAAASRRPRDTWATKGGHYGHSQIPGNDHWDPGNIDRAAIFAAAPTGSTTPAPKPPAPSKPTVDLSNLIAAARRDPGLKQGGTTHPADVRLVEAALKAEGLLAAKYASDGSFGSTTVAAYRKWQLKCGYTGSGADGIPGKASLEKLGTKRGFKVKA